MRAAIKEKIESAPLSQIDLGEMNIQDDEIDVIIMAIIAKRPTLSELFLNNNFLSDKGAELLAKKLLELPNLSVLDIQFNQIDKKGALALFALRVHNPQLQIAFHGNKITNVIEMEEIVQNALQKH